MASTARLRSPGTPRSPFRSVMGMWCVIVATLPIAASEFGLIPIHDSQRRMLPACAAFFCLLGLAYVFSLRHGLARTMFGAPLLWADTSLPHTRRTQRGSINSVLACLIVASIGAAATYLWAFESGRGLPTFPILPRSSADAVVLALSFVAMFLLAETAFAIMAVREYLQDVLGLSDAEVITGVPKDAEQMVAEVGLPGINYKAVFPPTSDDAQASEFLTEHAPAEDHSSGRKFLRRIRMTLSRS